MPNIPVVAPIVEGHGEVRAVPVLLRRIALETLGLPITVAQPWRLPKGQMRTSALASAASLHSGQIRTGSGVLVLVDADEDDPSSLATEIGAASGRQGVVVAVAVREFEAWFLAGLPSLTTHVAVKNDARHEGDPERIRGAKEALSQRMVESYKPMLHQTAFAAIVDLQLVAARSPSFKALVNSVDRLVSSQL